MKYDFDKVINRRNTDSLKWDSNPDKSLLPMWVADMDFPSPQPVIDAVVKKAEAGIFGYPNPSDNYYESIIGWVKKRHGFELQKEWISYSPGTVTAIHMLIRAYLQPGDKIIIQTPVYYPFYTSIENTKCEKVENPLKLVNGLYTMDFEDLENKAHDPKTKMMILSSPHNPVGRVWTKDELIRLGEICMKNDVIVISDEVHNDLIFKGFKHTPFAMLNEKFAQNSITLLAPSKTFNLAGLQTSAIIIPNPKLRELYNDVLSKNYIKRPNTFGMVALEAAYKYGEEWLEQLLDYLQGNLDFLIEYLKNNIPQIKVNNHQGTYLVWMDCRELGMDYKNMEEFMLKEAKIWFDEGYIFGTSGEGFERINIACPRATLADAVNRLANALRKRGIGI